jgi:hypothetical protein
MPTIPKITGKNELNNRGEVLHDIPVLPDNAIGDFAGLTGTAIFLSSTAGE